MKNLTDAIERMREVHEDFNGTISDLDNEMRILRARLTAYDRKMRLLGRDIGQVGRLSRSLADIMDGAIRHDDASIDDDVSPREHRRIGVPSDNGPGRKRA